MRAVLGIRDHDIGNCSGSYIRAPSSMSPCGGQYGL